MKTLSDSSIQLWSDSVHTKSLQANMSQNIKTLSRTYCSNQKLVIQVHIRTISEKDVVYTCKHRCHQLVHTETCTQACARTNTHTHTCLRQSEKNKRSHANPQMCRKTGGRQGREDWEKWSAWKEGRERDSDGEKGARGREGGDEARRAGCLLLFKRQWVLCAD